MTAMAPTFEHAEAVMRISHLVVFLAGMAVAMMPCTAKADIAYTFIKVTCDPASKSASVTTFTDWNGSGEARVEAHEKNTYEIGHIKNGTKTELCKFGPEETLAFKSYHDEARSASDSFYLIENGYKLQNPFSLAHEWTLYIHLRDDKKYSLKYCQKPEGLFEGKVSDQPIKCATSNMHKKTP